MQECSIALLDGLVVLVADNPRTVVTFQLHHNLDAVAEVVARERLPQRQLSLVVATDDTPMQNHLSLVPQAHSADICRPVPVALVACLRVGVQQKAIVFHHMTVLHCLHAVGAFRYAERKGSIVVGGDGTLVAIYHEHSVALELYAWYRDAGTLVIDIATIYIIGVDGEDEITPQVHVIVEADCLWLETARIAHRGNTDAVAACKLIDESSNFEIACGIRDGSLHFCSRDVTNRFGCHAKTSQSRAICQTHVAAHHACWCALSGDRLSVHLNAFALIDTLHTVVIDMLRTRFLIDVVELREVCGKRVPRLAVATAMFTA